MAARSDLRRSAVAHLRADSGTASVARNDAGCGRLRLQERRIHGRVAAKGVLHLYDVISTTFYLYRGSV